ncbi:SRPBCC family protein [Streptomyces roseus]|uniref:Polyketide cyclase n=1 Tax=Streptomyces roseus TaxID=66430 RepID=A0A0J6XI31_9ACTN|nr:SRPBCC family protein [Streptomyces roseus]KMO93877.1 polyketide cyclase [Streptomyces roseus]MYT23849.1 SRPBCC family protein [Streptomyces sp. SID7760]
MAVRHQLIHRSPQAVWAVLAEPSLYGEWVVGPSESTPLDQTWPEVGSRLRYTVRLGPWSAEGVTTVRHREPGRELELEASFKSLGTARIFLQLRQWGEETLVVCDEHPLRGLGGTLHNPAVEAFLQLRHRGMLGRLAKVVEQGRAGARSA